MRVIGLYDVIIDDQIIVFFVHPDVPIHQQILKIIVTGTSLDAVAYCLNLCSCVNSRNSLAWRILYTNILVVIVIKWYKALVWSL